MIIKGMVTAMTSKVAKVKLAILAILALSSGLIHATPATYLVNFLGSGVLPTVGAFTYDETTAASLTSRRRQPPLWCSRVVLANRRLRRPDLTC